MKPRWKKVWARDYCLLLGYYYGNAFGERNPFLVCKNKLFLPERKLYVSYVDEKEFNRLIQIFTAHILRVGIKKYAEQYQAEFKSSVKWAKKLVPANLGKLSNWQLAGKIREFHNYFQPFTTLQYTAFVVLEGPGREVEQMVSSMDDSQRILGLIATPYKLTKITQARLDLLKLVKNKTTSRADLKNYLKAYQWMSLNDMTHHPLSISDLSRQIRHIKNPQKEIENIIEKNREHLKQYRIFLNQIKSGKHRQLIEIVHYFSYLKEMRDDYRRQVYFILQPLFVEAAKRLELGAEQIYFLSAPEIVFCLEKNQNADRKLALRREKIYSISIINGKIRIYDKDISKQFLKHDASSGEVIAGQPAFNGLVKGKVKIINSPREFDRFKTGEILVTAMTHPEFLPIMKKAKAIVTDEGGITCHAAIVSRELGTPCIIGTKNATRSLKDGDLVEVDANKGIVRKI